MVTAFMREVRSRGSSRQLFAVDLVLNDPRANLVPMAPLPPLPTMEMSGDAGRRQGASQTGGTYKCTLCYTADKCWTHNPSSAVGAKWEAWSVLHPKEAAKIEAAKSAGKASK